MSSNLDIRYLTPGEFGTQHDGVDHTQAPFSLLSQAGHDGVDHTQAPFSLLSQAAHTLGLHTGLGLLDEAAHDALDHSGLAGVSTSYALGPYVPPGSAPNDFFLVGTGGTTARVPAPRAGTIDSIAMKLSAGGGALGGSTFRILVNGVPQGPVINYVAGPSFAQSGLGVVIAAADEIGVEWDTNPGAASAFGSDNNAFLFIK